MEREQSAPKFPEGDEGSDLKAGKCGWLEQGQSLVSGHCRGGHARLRLCPTSSRPLHLTQPTSLTLADARDTCPDRITSVEAWQLESPSEVFDAALKGKKVIDISWY